MFNSGKPSNRLLSTPIELDFGVDFLPLISSTQPRYTIYERFGTDLGNPTIFGINHDTFHVQPRGAFVDCVSVFPRLNDFDVLVNVLEFNQTKFACYVNYYLERNLNSPFADWEIVYLHQRFVFEVLQPLTAFGHWNTIRRTADVEKLDVLFGTNYHVSQPVLASLNSNEQTVSTEGNGYIIMTGDISVEDQYQSGSESGSFGNFESIGTGVGNWDDLSDSSDLDLIATSESTGGAFDFSALIGSIETVNTKTNDFALVSPVVESVIPATVDIPQVIPESNEFEVTSNESIVPVHMKTPTPFAFFGGTSVQVGIAYSRFGPIRIVRDNVTLPLIDIRMVPAGAFIDSLDTGSVITLSGELPILGAVDLGFKSKVFVVEFSEEASAIIGDCILVPMNWDSRKPSYFEVDSGEDYFLWLQERIALSKSQNISRLLHTLVNDDVSSFWEQSHYHEYFELIDTLSTLGSSTVFELVDRFSHNGVLVPCFFFNHIGFGRGRNDEERKSIERAAFNVYSLLGLYRGFFAGILSGLIRQDNQHVYYEANIFYVDNEMFSDAVIDAFMDNLEHNVAVKKVEAQIGEFLLNLSVAERHFEEFEGKKVLSGSRGSGLYYHNLDLTLLLELKLGNGQRFTSDPLDIRPKGNFSWYTKLLGYPRYPDPARSSGFFSKVSNKDNVSSMFLFEALSLQTFLVLKSIFMREELMESIKIETDPDVLTELKEKLNKVKINEENSNKKELVFGFSRALIKYFE